MGSKRKQQQIQQKRREIIQRNKQQQLQSNNVEQQTLSNNVELSIGFDNTQPYTSAPLKAFSTASANTTTLLHAISRELLTNDTAFIDYTAGATNDHPLTPLSDRFCDNVILYYFLPEEDVCSNPTLNKWLAKHNNTIENVEEQSRRITEALSPYLPENTQKLVRVFNTLDIPITKASVKPIQPAVKDNRLAQKLKVSLPDVALDKVLCLVSDVATQQLLASNGFYINDIDITQDFAGTINRQQVVRYLMAQHNERLQGDQSIADHKILDNSDKVGLNCLTFLTNDEMATVRYKFYSKFVQSLESPSIRGVVGSHIADWISNPEQILRSSISKSLDTGLLRLGITFYPLQQTLNRSYLMEHMDYLQQLLPPSLIYHQPISKQWEFYASTISSNLCVIDIDSKTALFSYAKKLKLLSKPSGNVSSLTTLDLSTKLYIYGIRYTNGRYGETVVLATNTSPSNKSLKLYWSNTSAKRFIDANKDIWGFVEPNIILSGTNRPLAILEIRDRYYNKSRNMCVNVLCVPVIHTSTNTIDEEAISAGLEEQLEEIERAYKETLQDSSLLVRDRKLTSKTSIDSVVKEGDVVCITACYKFRTTYIIECSINNNTPQLLKSNRFLDDLLDDASYKFKVMVGVKRFCAKAKKSYYSFLIGDDT